MNDLRNSRVAPLPLKSNLTFWSLCLYLNIKMSLLCKSIRYPEVSCYDAKHSWMLKTLNPFHLFFPWQEWAGHIAVCLDSLLMRLLGLGQVQRFLRLGWWSFTDKWERTLYVGITRVGRKNPKNGPKTPLSHDLRQPAPGQDACSWLDENLLLCPMGFCKLSRALRCGKKWREKRKGESKKGNMRRREGRHTVKREERKKRRTEAELSR